MIKKATIRDIELSGATVLVRVDFNVPIDDNTRLITDDSRIRAAQPTIEYLLSQNAKLVLCSHLGRPKGEVVDKLSLKIVAEQLSQILNRPVRFIRDCIGPEVETAVRELLPGEILLLENLRFHPEEEANDANFAQALAWLADVYVNDAFGTSHRAHASVSGITRYLPSVAGFLLEKELETLGDMLEKPARPFAALLGGAKVSDKLDMIARIMSKADYILIGGGMAATFLKARRCGIGLSLIEDDKIPVAGQLMAETLEQGRSLQLPDDVVVSNEISSEAATEAVSVEKIPCDKRIVDIGPKTVNRFKDTLRKCNTVFWNGPMGIYEVSYFGNGTRTIAKILAELDATKIIGGGSTSDVITGMGLVDKMTFISTGGGASLEFLSGKVLPGVDALIDRN